ncbi:MAG TPA: shikimate kinase [Usitatibacter sp.]|jgi:shikimate kinase|nr:shikimate kinase [Usitatibacter sp.]
MGRGNIYLVGMMGAGKTTLGKALGQRLGLEFVDMDRLLVEKTGVPVATIFEIEGEQGFRRREACALAEAASHDDRIVATGGGVVLAEENRRVMRESGTVVYLRARLESLWERTRHDTARPLLKTADPRGTLGRLLDERDPLYRDAAHVVVDTGSHSAPAALARVLAALKAHGALAGQDG